MIWTVRIGNGKAEPCLGLRSTWATVTITLDRDGLLR
jgi:hypothetical protein